MRPCQYRTSSTTKQLLIFLCCSGIHMLHEPNRSFLFTKLKMHIDVGMLQLLYVLRSSNSVRNCTQQTSHNLRLSMATTSCARVLDRGCLPVHMACSRTLQPVNLLLHLPLQQLPNNQNTVRTRPNSHKDDDCCSVYRTTSQRTPTHGPHHRRCHRWHHHLPKCHTQPCCTRANTG